MRFPPVLYVALLAALAPARAPAADWPHWRGPSRNGHTPEDSGWESGAWPPKQPVWSGSFGVGSSSPVVAEGRLYVTGWGEGKDHVHCIEAATG